MRCLFYLAFAMVVFVFILLGIGCHADGPRTNSDKRDARMETWSLHCNTERADEWSDDCLTILYAVEEKRQVLTARILDDQLSADVHDDLKVQRAQVLKQGQDEVDKLQCVVRSYESLIAVTKERLEQLKFDPTNDHDAIALDRVRQAESKLTTVKLQEKIVMDAWQQYLQGKLLREKKGPDSQRKKNSCRIER